MQHPWLADFMNTAPQATRIGRGASSSTDGGRPSEPPLSQEELEEWSEETFLNVWKGLEEQRIAVREEDDETSQDHFYVQVRGGN